MRSRVRFENELCEFLSNRGYNCMRSAGSRGPADVIAFNATSARIIQLKTTIHLNRKGNISIFADAVEKMRDIPSPPSTTHELWVKPLRRNWLYIVVSDMCQTTREEIKQGIRDAQWIEA